MTRPVGAETGRSPEGPVSGRGASAAPNRPSRPRSDLDRGHRGLPPPRVVDELAIDMQVSWSGVLRIRNARGRLMPIAPGPRDANSRAWAEVVAATHGVHGRFSDAAPHRPSDGH